MYEFTYSASVLDEVQLHLCASVFVFSAIYIAKNTHNLMKVDDISNRWVGILNLWTP